MNVWNYLLDIDKSSLETYSNALKALPENQVYDCLQNIEKLHLKLMLEFNTELKRGKRIGIITADNISYPKS